MDTVCNEEVWWGEQELTAKGVKLGLKQKAGHIEKCIDAFLAVSPNVPLGLVAEWSQRASYARKMASGECVSEQKRQLKTADERRAQADRRRIVRDECARCSLPFDRSETRKRTLWRLEVRARAEKEEGEEGDQRLVAVCEGCEQVHMVGRLPRLRGEKRERREEEEEGDGEWDARSCVSVGGASTSASSVFGSEKKRKGSLSSLCSTPSQLSSSISSSSPLVVSAAAKKSAKKKRGSELSRLLREKEEKKEEGGGLAAFLASLS